MSSTWTLSCPVSAGPASRRLKFGPFSVKRHMSSSLFLLARHPPRWADPTTPSIHLRARRPIAAPCAKWPVAAYISKQRALPKLTKPRERTLPRPVKAHTEAKALWPHQGPKTPIPEGTLREPLYRDACTHWPLNTHLDATSMYRAI